MCLREWYVEIPMCYTAFFRDKWRKHLLASGLKKLKALYLIILRTETRIKNIDFSQKAFNAVSASYSYETCFELS